MVIDWSFWTTVVGTIATVVFGIWAILLAKKRAYPGEITFFHDRSIRLFDDITGSLPQVAVSYKGEPVNKNLTLIKGFLVNTGTKDITKEMVETSLTFELVDGYRWLEVSANFLSSLEERAKINDSKTVEFSLGLFRCYEFLRFVGLIEVSEGKKWGGTIMTGHRIADTADIKWKKVPAKPKKTRWNYELWINLFFLFCLGTGFIYSAHKAEWTGPNGRPQFIAVVLIIGLGCLLASAFLMRNRFDRKIRKILRLDAD